MKSKKEKEQLFENIVKDLKARELCLFASLKGINTTEMFDWKKKLSQNNGAVRVVKNTILKKALEHLSMSPGDSAFFKGEIALLTPQNGDIVTIAKTLTEWAQENENVKIKGGLLPSKKEWINNDKIKRLASLPSLEGLQAKLLGTLQGPSMSLLLTLQASLMKFMLVLKAAYDAKAKA
ncbi:50S ribosomal protein L10 [Elusimicrobiota bacterium]